MLQPLVDDDLVVDDLRDPRLASIEEVDRFVYDRPGIGVGRVELGSPIPQFFDACSQIGHGGEG